jgi:tetratricopeptide (TPR) repeat protein
MTNSPGSLRSCLIAGLLVIAGSAHAAPSVTRDLAGTLSTISADSLIAPLRELESRSPGPAGARVAMMLGRLHLSRGEYREAVDAFGRAAARLDPASKAEARYWMGIAWLGAGQPAQARSLLEEMTREPSPWRAPGLVALARTWELSRRPDRAIEALDEAAKEPAGEHTPPLLERYAALQEAAGHPAVAERARERLIQDYPRSIEAAEARRVRVTAAEAGGGSVAVVIGTFLDPARARSLATAAQRAGFDDAKVVTKGEGLAAVHAVWVGTYSDAKKAQVAGEQAARALGVTWELTRAH